MSGAVAVLGRPAEGPTQMVLQALADEGIATVLLDQRPFASLPLHATVGDDASLGWLGHDVDVDGDVALETLAGLYLRPLDELRLWPDDAARGQACRTWTQGWVDVAERLPGRVANRVSAMVANGSKPYQSRQLAAAGFAVPPMLLSDEPQAVLDFEAEHGPLIYKSASGVRSIVQPLDAAAKLRLPAHPPLPDAVPEATARHQRARSRGGTATFCTEIDIDGLDYRYAARDGGNTTRHCATPRSTRRRAGALALQRRGAGARVAVRRAGPDARRRRADVLLRGQPQPRFQLVRGRHQPADRTHVGTLARWLAGRDGPETATAADHVLPRPTGAISASGTRRRTAGGPERSVVAIRISAENSRYPFLTAFSARQE